MWRVIAAVRVDGLSRVTLEDTLVVAGSRYAYALRVNRDGSELILGETWLDVPSSSRLQLFGATPNPAVDDWNVRFSLPDRVPASFEVFDIAGRLVFSREVGALGAGSHVMRITRPLVPGVYVLRLSRGTSAVTARVVIMR